MKSMCNIFKENNPGEIPVKTSRKDCFIVFNLCWELFALSSGESDVTVV